MQKYENHSLLPEGNQENPRFTQRTKIIIGILVTAIILVGIIVGVVVASQKSKSSNHFNVIMMISDGMGPASVTLARAAKGGKLVFDAYLVGTVRTPSSDSLVTDSAAGATAYACGVHTYNGGIGINANATACGTILEAAHGLGMKTGLVVTTRLTDATPASFGAHANFRSQEDYIALQLLDQVPGGFVKNIDVMLGGGGAYFTNRSDGKNLSAVAMELGYYVSTNWIETLASTASKLLGLYTLGNFPFEIDRINSPIYNATLPSLADMTKKALATLNYNNQNGFFLMVEGSQIDLAGHNNDAGSQIPEVLAYSDAWQAVLDFAIKDGHTIIISTSDHETGGLTLAYQSNLSISANYAYYPELLLMQNASAAVMASYVQKGQDVETVLQTYANVTNLTDDELSFINSFVNGTYPQLTVAIGRVISQRALIGFSTSGHSGVDVNLYAYIPPGFDLPTIQGNVLNTDVGAFLQTLLNANLLTITESLKDFNTTG